MTKTEEIAYRRTLGELKKVLVSNGYEKILCIPSRRFSLTRTAYFSNLKNYESPVFASLLYLPFELVNLIKLFLGKNQLFKFSVFPGFHLKVFSLIYPKISVLFRLFFWCEPVEEETLLNIFSEELLKSIIKEKIFYRDSAGRISSSIAITPIFGKFIIESAKLRSMGLSAYNLAKAINDTLLEKKFKNYLDMCTGTGVYAVLFWDKFKKTLAADIDEKALEVARLNILFNDAQKVDFIETDGFEKISGKYDLITINPPFGFVPDTYKYGYMGKGGEYGIEVSTKLLKGVDGHLNDDGCCIMITMTPMVNGRNLLAENLKMLFSSKYSVSMSVLADLTFSDLIDFFKKHGVSSMKYVLITLKKDSGNSFVIKELSFQKKIFYCLIRGVIHLEHALSKK